MSKKNKYYRVNVNFVGYAEVEAKNEKEAIEIATRLPLNWYDAMISYVDTSAKDAVVLLGEADSGGHAFSVDDLISEGIVSCPEELYW